MIRDLPSTSTGAVVKELLRLRDSVGAMAMGRVLTLLVAVSEDRADEAIAAANDATRQHPARILVLVSANSRGRGRLDAQIRVGGDAGASEIVVLRLYGELSRQLGPVVTPLLLPDSPVVAWWPAEAPADVADSPVGRIAHRRITDAAAQGRARTALRRRSRSYVAGDTDLTWTRITRWRALLASSLEGPPYEPVTSASVVAEPDDPSAALLAGWLATALRVPVARVRSATGSGLVSVRLDRASGPIDLVRSEDGSDTAVLDRPGSQPRLVALHTPTLAEALSEELRRLDADEVYARTLCEGLPLVRRGATRSEAGRAGEVPSGPAPVRPTGGADAGPRSGALPAESVDPERLEALVEDRLARAVSSDVRVHADKGAVAVAVADELCRRVADAVAARGEAHVVLTGGSMGEAVMTELATRARSGDLDEQVWRATHLWWGDERFVPSGDEDRNDAQADAAGLGDLPVLKKHVHRVPSGTGAVRLEAAAARYAADLAAEALRGAGPAEVPVPRFDVVMLGVGPDGHVASLFPDHPALAEQVRTTVAVDDSPKPPPHRVSLTLPAINAARAVWLVVAGADKAEAVRVSLDDGPLPAARVAGTGETVWWVDEAAASR